MFSLSFIVIRYAFFLYAYLHFLGCVLFCIESYCYWIAIIIDRFLIIRKEGKDQQAIRENRNVPVVKLQADDVTEGSDKIF